MRRARRGSGDRGAVLIVVAAFAIVAVIFLAVVIDVGGLRAEKKEVTLSTDAAALAAVSVIDFSDPQAMGTDVPCGNVDSTDTRFGPTVQHVALHYLAENGGSVLGDCRIFFEGVGTKAGYVTVTASDRVDYAFEGATGLPSGDAYGSSSARITDGSGGNLYPVGMCSAGAVAALGSNPSGVFDPPIYENPQFENAACGGAGNKRQIQFIEDESGNQCGSAGMWCWDFNNGGFDGAPQIVESDTGKDWQKAEDVINDFIDDGTHIWVPAVEARPDLSTGGGTKFKYEVTHFIEVQILSYSKQDGLELAIYQVVPYDSEGPPATTVAPSVDAHLCAVGSDTSPCTNNAAPTPPADPDPPPGGDDCAVDATAPGDQSVPVASGVSTGPVTASITVVDTADCGAITMAAVSGAASIAAPSPTNSGNTFTFTFPTGTAFGAPGLTYTIQFYGGGVLDDSLHLTTTSATAPCVTTGPPTWPSAPSRSGQSSNLSSDLEVTVPVSAAPCPGLSIRVVRLNGSGAVIGTFNGTPEQDGNAYRANFARQGNSAPSGFWDAGVYRVEVLVSGAVVQSASFTLS